MKKMGFLLCGVVVLFLGLSLALHLTYGSSYPFLAGEDCWQPDGSGGWMKHGSPADPAPSEPSVEVPLLLNYVPIFVPALLLILFMFTPLRHKLESPAEVEDKTEAAPDEE